MSRYCSSAVLVLLLWLYATAVQAQYGGYGGYHPRLRTPEQVSEAQKLVLSSYCRADFEGARLSREGADRLRSLLAFKLAPDFTSFAVVSRYDIPADASKPDVVVSYKLLGRWENAIGFQRESADERTVFHMVEREGDLLIGNIDPVEPRVSGEGRSGISPAAACGRDRRAAPPHAQ